MVFEMNKEEVALDMNKKEMMVLDTDREVAVLGMGRKMMVHDTDREVVVLEMNMEVVALDSWNMENWGFFSFDFANQNLDSSSIHHNMNHYSGVSSKPCDLSPLFFLSTTHQKVLNAPCGKQESKEERTEF